MRPFPVFMLYCLAATTVKSQEKLYPNTLPLEDVTLLEGPFKNARDLNIKVLLQYDLDRLLVPFRIEAGPDPQAEADPNWEDIAGHVGGHYLSALAISGLCREARPVPFMASD